MKIVVMNLLQDLSAVLSATTVDHGQGCSFCTEHARTCTVSARWLFWSLRERTSKGCFYFI